MKRRYSDVSKERNYKATDSKRCWTEISLSRIKRNFKIYGGSLPEGFKIIPVIKADAYGHGASAVAKALSPLGVPLFAVATVDEAVQLRRDGVSEEILILGYTSPEEAERLYEYGLTQTLTDDFYAEELAAATDKRLVAQYAIDTGMHRIGLDACFPSRCERAIRRGAELFRLNGLFTHLASADSGEEKGRVMAQAQIERFSHVAKRVEDMALPFVHCLNTAGGLSYAELPECVGRFVRLGISLYGLAPSEEVLLPSGIEPALSWYATVASVRAVKRGETVGYGTDFRMERSGIIATLTAGYADGYSRSASCGRAYVLINGQRAPVVGRVCMDQTMVDVSRVSHVRAGDTAVLIGRSGEEIITADGLGRMLGTIGYEVVCGISPRVAKYYGNGTEITD